MLAAAGVADHRQHAVGEIREGRRAVKTNPSSSVSFSGLASVIRPVYVPRQRAGCPVTGWAGHDQSR
jgi:hypothetical protein